MCQARCTGLCTNVWILFSVYLQKSTHGIKCKSFYLSKQLGTLCAQRRRRDGGGDEIGGMKWMIAREGGRSKIGSALTSRELHLHRHNQLHLQEYIKRHPDNIRLDLIKNDQSLIPFFSLQIGQHVWETTEEITKCRNDAASKGWVKRKDGSGQQRRMKYTTEEDEKHE